ncbi:hypothetical protein HanRHA438_Chr04g0197041 [Helianthus annuus]|nr:hypothetical protein HanOQP8_Chr04g0165171 [Helianthus annuus]KAJ0928707.1 hypothetical protein HanRHA438_Chr04g0197041 [Helianthus annuus]
MSGVDRFGAGGDECTPPRFQQHGGDDEYSDGVRFSDYAMVVAQSERQTTVAVYRLGFLQGHVDLKSQEQ